MPVYFDKARKRWRFEFSRLVGGRRRRATKLLPAAWTRAQAEAYSRAQDAHLYAVATGATREQPLISQAVGLYLAEHAPGLKNRALLERDLSLVLPWYAGRRMSELADAFIALPGGFGTLEELLEAATLTQLGDHAKACAALDVRGFYRPLRALLETATDEGFLKPEHRDMLVIEADPARLLDALAAWTPPTVSKWIGQPGS